MNLLEKEVWQTRAGKLICLAIVLSLIYVVLRYGMGLLIPFLIAWAVAVPISALAKRSERKLGGKRRAWVYFYMFFFLGALLFVFAFLVGRLIAEAAEFLEYLSKNGEVIEQTINRILSLPSKIPILNKLGEIDLKGLGAYISSAAGSIAESIAAAGGETFMSAVGGAIAGTPRMLISFVVAILSSLYLALDYDGIKEYLYSLMREDNRRKTMALIDRIGKGIRGYFGAYGKIFLITFGELYLGLFLLGRSYSFLAAIGIAFFDILPFFGAGMVLIPWGIILLANGNYGVGVGMLVLFGVVAIVRQIIEPRLIGKSIGIHPLASLLSMYVGFRLFGFWGMIIAPVGVLVAKEIIEGANADP